MTRVIEMAAWDAKPQARPKLNIIQSVISSFVSMPNLTEAPMRYAKQPVIAPISRVRVYFAMVSPVYLQRSHFLTSPLYPCR
eukprot:7116148-Pyramimonas_sp.AAC.2